MQTRSSTHRTRRQRIAEPPATAVARMTVMILLRGLGVANGVLTLEESDGKTSSELGRRRVVEERDNCLYESVVVNTTLL